MKSCLVVFIFSTNLTVENTVEGTVAEMRHFTSTTSLIGQLFTRRRNYYVWSELRYVYRLLLNKIKFYIKNNFRLWVWTSGSRLAPCSKDVCLWSQNTLPLSKYWKKRPKQMKKRPIFICLGIYLWFIG